MQLKDPKVIRVILTALVSGVVLWGYFLSDLLPFGYTRRSARTRELRETHETMTADLEKVRRTIERLPQVEKENRELERKWRQAESLLPSDKEVAELLTQVTKAGEQAGVTFEVFRPGASKPQEFYNENPVEVKVKGAFHQVGVFLARLANLERIVNVSDLQLEGLTPKSGKDQKNSGVKGPRTDHTLSAGFTATAYSLRDPSAVVEDAPPAERPGRRGRKDNNRSERRKH